MRRLRVWGLGGPHILISCCPSLGRKQSLEGIIENIMLIKEKVKEKLRLLGTPGSWDHITEQKGSHSYLGLNCKCLGRGSSSLSDFVFGLVFKHKHQGFVDQFLASESRFWILS